VQQLPKISDIVRVTRVSLSLNSQAVNRCATMKLASRDGQSLELRILGYQFPHLETEEYDSNWLVVTGKVTHSRGSWQFTEPCLLTYEAEKLASWMDDVADAKPGFDTCGFIEPNLEFRALLSIDRPALRVCFDLEARPSRASSGLAEQRTFGSSFRLKSST
jgi:hypothetical protein